ncbi:MAG: hypothetical protein IJY89_03210 [Clostridia bacterium]|nr:hypothetical protein [Clostridia bacterium]
MKKGLALLLVLGMLLALTACGKTKLLHCANCNKEVEVAADSNMNEDWILYCSECEMLLGLDNIVDEK